MKDNQEHAPATPTHPLLTGLENKLERGKGFTLFNASESDVDLFKEEFTRLEIPFTFIRMSTDLAQYETDGSKPLIVVQDVRRRELLGKIDTFVNKILYPAWHARQSIIFINRYDKKENSVGEIPATLVHQDYLCVLELLGLEQMTNLLKMVNVTLNAPVLYKYYNEDLLYTPIEIYLRDELIKRNIAFEPQVKLGRFYVDFLVEANRRKIIVECDGRAFHSAEKDAARDRELQLEGYRIIRFTGSELYHDAAHCVDRLLYQSNKSERKKYPLEKLNEEQEVAVTHKDGPMRLLAPAGSGKTKTLINRICHLLNEGVAQEDILALAFNKKASDDMEERLQNQFGVSGVNVKTFHSFGNQIIQEKLKWKFDAKKEKKGTRSLLKSAVERHVTIRYQRDQDPLDSYLDKLSQVKNQLLPYTDFYVEKEKDNTLIDFKPVFDDYLSGITKHSFYNFDDMLYLAARLLLKHSELRTRVQNRYKYILVDEFQDLNKVQLLLLEIIALPENNLFIVGDDDQMIYGFRGAEIAHILEFNERYTVTTDQVLKINYRSTKQLVHQSKWLIDHNQSRVYKDIQPNATQKGKTTLYIGDSLYSQANEAGQWILKKKNENNRWSDFAILFRKNEYQTLLFIVLTEMGIPAPFKEARALTSKPGNCLLAYVKTVYAPEDCDAETFRTILNKPNQYLTNDFIATIQSWEDLTDIDTALKRLPTMNQGRYRQFVEKLIQLKETVGKFTPDQLLATIVDDFGLEAYYRDQSKLYRDSDASTDHELMTIVLEMAKSFSSMANMYRIWTHDDSLKESDSPEGKDQVILNTIHKTKGNEFQHVVYFNLAKQNTEQSTEADIEEERRVAYVGVTRAEQSLLITTPKEEISPFVYEYFLNPSFKENSDADLNKQIDILKTRAYVKHTEITRLQETLEALEHDIPELTGQPVVIEKPFRKIKEVFRNKKVEKKMLVYEDLLNEKKDKHDDLEATSTKRAEISYELKYRNLLFNQPDDK